MKKTNEVLNVLRNICLCCVIVFGLIAIVGSNGGGDGDGDGDSGSSLTITGESGNQVNLNGSWSAGCIPDVSAGESEKFVNTISGSSFSITSDIWINSTRCSGTSDITVSMSGTTTLGGEVTATLSGSPVTATKIDMVISTAQFTINNEDVVSYFNSGEGVCDFTDWVAGTAKDVLGTDCAPDTSLKSITYIDDTADPDLMYEGDEDETLDDNGYPTTLDPNDPEARM